MPAPFFTCLTASDYETAVGHPAVLFLKLFFRNKCYRRIILVKIIRHRPDGVLDRLKICALFRNHIAFPQMLISRSKIRLASAPYTVYRRFNRNRILDSVPDAVYPADCVRMSLADALSPECIGTSLRQDRLRIQTVQGEHARIPSHGNDADMPSFLCRFIHISEILRYPCMSIEAVNGVEIRRNLRTHLRQVRSRTAAKHQHIDLILHRKHIVHMLHYRSIRMNLHARRIPPGEDRLKLHILVPGNRKLHAAPDISISYNSDSYLFHI